MHILGYFTIILCISGGGGVVFGQRYILCSPRVENCQRVLDKALPCFARKAIRHMKIHVYCCYIAFICIANEVRECDFAFGLLLTAHRPQPAIRHSNPLRNPRKCNTRFWQWDSSMSTAHCTHTHHIPHTSYGLYHFTTPNPLPPTWLTPIFKWLSSTLSRPY